MSKKGAYVVAVSGGVDSVVLLDMLARTENLTLVVAHFDHGIREDAFEDVVFVQELAQKYGLPFELGQAELGKGASEERARKARYEFLREVAKKHEAQIVTAHHADDVLETMVLNIKRGTGWRGLASLRSTAEIARPLLAYRKRQLVEYAQQHGLAWREDSTNNQTKYTRNHIRKHILPKLGEQTEQWLLATYKKQLALRHEIEQLAKETRQTVRREDGYARYPFIMGDEKVMRELLYEYARLEAGRGTTRPRLERALLAIKTAPHNSIFEMGDGVCLRFTKQSFTVVTKD